MKAELECIPCFLKQALEAARMATDDGVRQREVLDEVAKVVDQLPLDKSPSEASRIVHRRVREVTGLNDPYKGVKEKYNKIALSLYPELKEKVKASADPLLCAIKVAIAGNIIDFGIGLDFDIDRDLDRVLSAEFAIFDYEEFKETLARAKKVLYLADNAGEVAFDRVLVERLDKDVIYAVKGSPIINDALMDDAKFCGIDKVAQIISSGSDAPGTVLGLCSQEFLNYYNTADLIISKGQGNFEVLSDEPKPIFFLSIVKCSVVAQHLGVKVGDIILKRGKNF